MPEHFTVRPGPGVIVLHQEPHFDRDGCCTCSCPDCSRVVSRTATTTLEDCICPGCPCTEAVSAK
jgi:hypothetical protein